MAYESKSSRKLAKMAKKLGNIEEESESCEKKKKKKKKKKKIKKIKKKKWRDKTACAAATLLLRVPAARGASRCAPRAAPGMHMARNAHAARGKSRRKMAEKSHRGRRPSCSGRKWREQSTEKK